MGMTSYLYLIFSNLAMTISILSIINFPQWLFANADLIPLYPALLIVGGVIIVTLSYVSWRKYKGENEKRNESEKKRDKLVD